MIITDREDFADSMIRCFQNYRANISKEMVDEWFKELKQYPLYNIKKAFAKYINEEEKFPPTRATIIKFAKMQFGIDKAESKSELGCVNMLGDKNCGKEILVHQHCEECYDAKRPKSFVDQIRETRLAEWIARAKADGCETDREVADWSRKQMGMSPLGQLFLKNHEKPESEHRRSGLTDIGKECSGMGHA